MPLTRMLDGLEPTLVSHTLISCKTRYAQYRSKHDTSCLISIAQSKLMTPLSCSNLGKPMMLPLKTPYSNVSTPIQRQSNHLQRLQSSWPDSKPQKPVSICTQSRFIHNQTLCWVSPVGPARHLLTNNIIIHSPPPMV